MLKRITNTRVEQTVMFLEFYRENKKVRAVGLLNS